MYLVFGGKSDPYSVRVAGVVRRRRVIMMESNHRIEVESNRAHAEKYFRNINKSNRNQIVFTIFRLIGIQTDVRLVQVNRCVVNTI